MGVASFSDVRVISFMIESEIENVVSFVGGGGNISASEGVKNDDPVDFMRDSMLLGARCGSSNAIVAEPFDVERSITVTPAAEASECVSLFL